jgi:atypical dual specificity phosphatase
MLFLPTLAWNVLLGRILRIRHWWDTVDDQLLIGALPFSWDVKRLAQEGVTGVVNMCLEYEGPRRAYRQHEISQLWLPTTDFTPPSLEDVERGVAFITAQLEKGGTVYVHCKAGRGLIQAKGFSPEQAAAFLTQRRPHVNQGLAERDVVQTFYRNHRNSS